MALIDWQSSFGIGIAAIDADHRMLCDLVNQLHDAKETGQAHDVVASVFNVFVEYTERHFDREESLMRLADFPDQAAHRQEHAGMRHRLRAIQDRIRCGDRSAVDEEVVDFLQNWLKGHITESDRSYGPWLEGGDNGDRRRLEHLRMDLFVVDRDRESGRS